MLGFEKTKTTLEFGKIIQHVSEKCVSETGKQRLLNSRPLMEKQILLQSLSEIGEMREVLAVEGGFPIWTFEDVRVLMNKIEPRESYLEIDDFRELQNFLEVVHTLSDFGQKFEEKFPKLTAILKQLVRKEKLLNQIRYTIEPSGRIFDNASPELKQIRNEIRRVDHEIHHKLDNLLKKKSEHIREEYITLRDGRLVVPVREFSVNKVPGIVHGQSASGATYFVEPMPVVDLNNQMQQLLAEERKELIKILKRMSRQAKEEELDLVLNLDLLNELDVIRAKAQYANDVEAVAPEISDGFALNLNKARHPLLLNMHGRETVPLDIHAGEDFNILLISGPNAGGKTVALKTVGILQLLFQSGFHIPAAEGTQLPICQQIFSVIGDEQSIEQDLSTFSSHIKAIDDVLRNVETQAMVLIDEIGSGTEPTGGAALAIAILERLNRSALITLATTHQNQIKAYAGETEGIANAAMQFDREHLSPLFTLEIDIPGSSYTFEICRRLGLDEHLLQKAMTIAGKEVFELDQLLTDVVEKSRQYQRLKERLSLRETELNSLMRLYRDRNEDIKRKRKEYEKKAREEARQIIENANRELENAIKEIKEAGADKVSIRNARERIARQKRDLQPEVKEETPEKTVTIEQLNPGQRVRSRQYDIKGRVSRLFPNRSEVEVDKDGLKITIPVGDLEPIDEHSQPIQQKHVSIRDESSASVSGVNISNEIDLRGMTVDEALTSLQSYLDQAVMSSWEEVRIVHGKGTGALRNAIQQYLSNRADIMDFRSGRYGEGEAGVTVIKIT